MVVQKSGENMNKGVDYMLMAAEAGDRSAMLYMAKAYETGVGLGENRWNKPLFSVDLISCNYTGNTPIRSSHMIWTSAPLSVLSTQPESLSYAAFITGFGLRFIVE